MTHRQGVRLRVQIGAAIELPRFLLGVQRLTQRIDRLVEIRRGDVGTESVHRPLREAMAFARGDETSGNAIGVGRLTLRDEGIEITWRDAGWSTLVGDMLPGTIGAELVEFEQMQDCLA